MSEGTVPVLPHSVRVWTGFRLGSLNQQKFLDKLGSFFMPGTVQIQAPKGLTAYLPSVMPKHIPKGTPDEIALVFYEYPDAYDEAKLTVGGRTYSDVHGVAFDLGISLSGFPSKFEGSFETDGRYYLFDEQVDWQKGFVQVFMGVREGDDKAAYLDSVAAFASSVQAQHGDGIDGAVIAGSSFYTVYWEHWTDADSARKSLIPELAKISKPVYNQPIEPYPISEGVWDDYKPLKVSGGESYNFQFARRNKTS